MYKYLLIALLIPGMAMAEQDPCQSVQQSAAQIMEYRQNGYSMAKLMQQLEDSKMGQALVKDAYSWRRYHSDEMQKRSVQEFRNKVYRACLQRFDGEKKRDDGVEI